MAAVADSISPELIDWAAASGCTRLFQAAEWLSPGLSGPWEAWRAYSSISEAARGNFARALQQFPFTTLAPDFLLDALDAHLSPWLPDAIARGPDYHDVVMLGGLLALRYEMRRQGPRMGAGNPRGDAVRTAVSRLRAALNVLGGLRGIVNRTAPAASPLLAIEGPSMQLPCSRHNRTSGACTQLLAAEFSAASQQMQAAVAGPPSSFGGGWITGADAARARPARPSPSQTRPAARPPAKPAVRRHMHRASVSISQQQRPGRPVLKPPVVGVSATAHASDNNKETMMQPAGSRSNTGSRRQAGPDVRRTVVGRPRDAENTGAGSDDDKAVAKSRPHGRRTPDRPVDSVPAVPVATPAGVPSCLEFHHATDAAVQVVHSRFHREPARFCVHPNAAPLFAQQLNVPRIAGQEEGEWLVPAVVQERLPDALRSLQIERSSRLGQRDRPEQRVPAPLADDRVYFVPTIAVLPSQPLHRHRVAGDRILPQNSLKLVRHLQLDGTWRRFVAYFINRSGDHDTGTRAGFLEIETAARRFTVHDPKTGFAFSSDTLDDLVAGLETISGCRFRPDADELPLLQRRVRGQLPHTDAMNLFVREAALARPTPPYSRQPFNADLDFFDAVRFEFRDGLITGLLFRNCFTVIGGSVVFVDRDGQLGTLQFSAGDARSGRHTLQQHHGFEAQLIRDHGLSEGEAYTMPDVAEILLNYGMHRLSLDDAPPQPPAARLDGFHIVSPRPAPATGSQPPSPPDLPAGPLPSSFRVHDDEIFYTDHDGSRGVLRFLRTQAGNLMLIESSGAAAERFAQRMGIAGGHARSLDDIRSLLHDDGMVETTDPWPPAAPVASS